MSLVSVKKQFQNIFYVSLACVLAMILVELVIVPAQKNFLPEITTFAALIFPVHGVRVIAAWLFGIWSVLYLFIANIIMYLTLYSENDLSINSFYAWCLVSAVAWFSFEIFRFCGLNFYENGRSITSNTWRHLMLVAFFSSVLNSLGHNIIYAKEILPENSFNTLLAFIIGDTLGTFICFMLLIGAFRFLRTMGK